MLIVTTATAVKMLTRYDTVAGQLRGDIVSSSSSSNLSIVRRPVAAAAVASPLRRGSLSLDRQSEAGRG